MGLCFSKKQQVRRRREEQPCNEAKKSGGVVGGKKAGAKEVAVVSEAKKAPQAKPAPSKKAVPKAEEPAADKRTVFVVKAAAAAAAAEVAAGENGELQEVKRPVPEEEAKPVVVSRVPVRTSSCTKEEVDAILIQCGRLSRSSSASGKVASGESGGGHRRYSGSKRSYDFDLEGRGGGVDDDCDWQRQGAAVSRPSPRRRTPERKRSGSHERSGGNGSRRVSRSPGRRADSVPATASGERASRQQPGKMVSVPAREKGRAPSPVPAASGKRYPSPRSNSPARAGAAGNENAAVQPAHGPSLSRSSSRKAEQSPYRRNPMAELDENTLANHHNNNNNGRPQKKPMDSGGALPQKVAERAKDQVAASRTAKEKQEIVEEAVASDTKGNFGRMKATHSVSIVAESVVNQKGRSSRRSSRDFDNNGNSYASLLLEDIQNYHQQSTGPGAPAPAFSLPACVSKACSILEAVADLNSSSSENKSFELDQSANDKCSANGRYGDGKAAAGGTVVVESEVVVKDDLMEPSLHKYVSVRDIRGETEPQESAGSNSFAGNPWTPSWEPTSVDSTDRTWTASQSNNGDEVEQLSSGAVSPLELSWQSKQKLPSSQEPSDRSRVGSTGNAQRGRSAHRGGGAVNVRSDVRAAPVSSSIV
ncbi:hypothetical protein E2562_025259 [Oryza meyeriana var. granulata]|uniref:Uncharacterized protein n=1 Tax=Oryza meyeriana var. granulata TaxID=110450 RepID=A0A6G1C006_9ORYZ|nr:hypothetical protein E2562_025259 [Oryza meyeriana var. granulata]